MVSEKYWQILTPEKKKPVVSELPELESAKNAAGSACFVLDRVGETGNSHIYCLSINHDSASVRQNYTCLQIDVSLS